LNCYSLPRAMMHDDVADTAARGQASIVVR
jgi:hypothetical protein